MTAWLASANLLGSGTIDVWDAIARAAIVYVAALAIIRMGKKRFLGRNTPFDVVIAVVLGSIAARAIVGGTPVLPAIGAMAALVALHWLLSLGAMHSRRFGFLVKGSNRTLMRDGMIDWRAMRAEHLTLHDLEEDAREKGLASLDEAGEVRIERDGRLSFVPRRPSREPENDS